MQTQFTYYLPTKLIVGQPAVEAVRDELAALDIERVLLVSGSGLTESGLATKMDVAIKQAGLESHPFIEMSSNPTPVEVNNGATLARQHNIQAAVGLGSGSVIDAAKVIAMLLTNGGSYADYQGNDSAITQRSVPLLAVPTTAGAGSEAGKSANVVDPEQPLKKGVRSPLMFAHTAILDPELTRSISPKLTASGGMDAFTHAVEAYIGQRAHPVTDALAVESMRTIWRMLPRAVGNGDDLEARQALMIAAFWAGTAMDHAGLGLLHAFSGPFTRHLRLHHGQANALLLPYVLAFNLPNVAPERKRSLKEIVGLTADAGDAALIEQVTQFVRQLNLPARLIGLEIPLERIDWERIAQETAQMSLIENNPRPVTLVDCRRILGKMIRA